MKEPPSLFEADRSNGTGGHLTGQTMRGPATLHFGVLATITGHPVIVLIVISTLARLALAAVTGLGIDESYMVGNARSFSWSYLDHPPLHVWIAAAMVRLSGSEAAIVVRLPFILLFAGSTWFLFSLATRLFGKQAGFWAALAFNLAPVFSVGDGSYVLPDGPLIFFLLFCADVIVVILFDERLQNPILFWIISGGLAGLALLSKYSAAFFIVAVFAYLLTEQSARKWLETPGPWLALLVAAVLFAPVLLWNIAHDLAGFAFQYRRLGASSETALKLIGESLGGQAAYLTPWLLLSLAVCLVRALVGGPRDPRTWFLVLLAIGPIGFFTLLSLRAKVLPHWPMPGWLFLLPLFGEAVSKAARARPKLIKGLAAGWAAALLLVSTAATVQAAGLDLRQETLHMLGIADPTIDLVDWSGLQQAFAARGLVKGLVVAAPVWIVAGKLSYGLGPSVAVLCLCDEPHHFRFRADPANFIGRDVILVALAGRTQGTPDTFDRYFKSIEPMSPVTIERRGEPVLILDLAIGHGLLPVKY